MSVVTDCVLHGIIVTVHPLCIGFSPSPVMDPDPAIIRPEIKLNSRGMNNLLAAFYPGIIFHCGRGLMSAFWRPNFMDTSQDIGLVFKIPWPLHFYS